MREEPQLEFSLSWSRRAVAREQAVDLDMFPQCGERAVVQVAQDALRHPAAARAAIGRTVRCVIRRSLTIRHREAEGREECSDEE